MIIVFNYFDEIPDKNPPIAIPKFAKKSTPKRQAHNMYTMSMNLHNYAVIFFFFDFLLCTIEKGISIMKIAKTCYLLLNAHYTFKKIFYSNSVGLIEDYFWFLG